MRRTNIIVVRQPMMNAPCEGAGNLFLDIIFIMATLSKHME
jgi:hypothetical protein